MAARDTNSIQSALRRAERSARRTAGPGLRRAAATSLALALALGLGGAAQGQSVTQEVPLPLDLPAIEPAAPADGPVGPEVARLKDALKEMDAQNPVVARVDGYEIRWSEVVASAGDLPPRYRDQIESVFPALLDRLVDLRLLAEAARAEGLAEDPVVLDRVARYEDRVLSSVLLERYLEDKVTTAALRARYDALVARRRADAEIRARHIVVDSKEAAAALIAELDAGAVFISLAKAHSTGSSAARGGDLGYFHPSRMDPAFAEAALALEPGEFTREPVETDFGWHVILLVDRRADNVPSFLDMQASLRDEARKEAVDRLVLGLRSQAYLEMFPEDAPGEDAGGGAASQAGAGQ